MADNLEEKKSADGQSEIMDPVTGEGGEPKQSSTGADTRKKVDPKADKVADGVTKQTNKPEEVVESDHEDDEDDEDDDKMKKAKKADHDDGEDEMEESFDISSLFEGLDLSEGFKEKASLVFEAAVNEAASEKAKGLAESIESDLQEQFETSLTESIDEIIENLDGYLDYIVKEWMEENEVAIDAGIKVEMAESFMNGLKELFYEHNVEIDEETIDVVAELEEQLAAAEKTANKAINESIESKEEVQNLRSEKIFESMTNGLSAQQVERFRVLSEKLNKTDLDEYTADLGTLKESFFKAKKETVISEDLDREGEELVVEEEIKKPQSQYDSVNAYADALKNLK